MLWLAFIILAHLPLPADSNAARVDALFAPWNKPDSPGCSVGVSRDGAPVYEHGYGMANLDYGIPITPATVFHVASVSKQFTAMSVLLLAQRGQLSLDDEARKFIPELPDYGTRLTIRHLLTHTSGLRDAFLLLGLGAPRDDASDASEQAVAALVRQRGLNFTPGTEFSYNNGGYTMLGSIVHRVSGQTLRAFADANIFKPLGMTQTRFHDDPTEIIPNRASGYHRVGDAFRLAPRYDPGGLVGNAGLFTTERDLLRWEQNFADARVGDPKLLAAMQTPATLTTGEKAPYGFGLFIGERHGLRTISHGGGDQGVSAWVVRYPDRGLAIALLCNADGIDVGSLANNIADIYLGDSTTTQAGRTPPQTPTTGVTLSAEQLAHFAGLYKSASGGEIYGRFLVRDGQLVAVPNAGERDAFPLTAISPTRFIIPGLEIVVEFMPHAPGQPQEVHVTGDGPKTSISRQVMATFTPSAAELQAFAGVFHSDELDVTYRLSPRDNGLHVDSPGRAGELLRPLFPDAFTTGGGEVVEFARDARGAITGFTINAAGAQGLRFDRVPR
jgi:CubicO group peptidase (beta-lactamase class C family)